MHRNSDITSGTQRASPHTHKTHRQPSKPLVEIRSFGSNPGGLRGYVQVPMDLLPDAPLVVVLHGCTQTAEHYDAASGWTQLAEELGFVLLFPEQRRINNFGLCFNWFEPADTARDSGEALSIRQMIAATQSIQAIDQSRIFITGFSGGGAMTAAMLAVYPEVFAGGAIIAGMPYGVATGTLEAFARMQGYGLPGTDELAAKIVQTSQYAGPWPTISIWHGAEDHTVNVANADAIARQWRAVSTLPDSPSRSDIIDGVPHRVWCDANGRTLVEDYIVPAMGHGTPLDLSGADPYGALAPCMLDVGISSTLRMAQFWDLARAASSNSTTETAGQATGRHYDGPIKMSGSPGKRSTIARFVHGALRAAGLKS